MSGLAFERMYPWAFAVLVTIIAHFLGFSVDGKPILILLSLIVSAILVEVSVILLKELREAERQNNKAVLFMQQIDKLPVVLKYLRFGVLISFVFSGVSAFLLFGLSAPFQLINLLWFFLGSFSLALAYRSISIASILLRAEPSAIFKKK